MPESYVEVSIRSDVDSGELLGMLQGTEATGCWDENGIIHIYWPEDKFSQGILGDLKKALADLGSETEESLPSIRLIPDTDWNAAWVASLVPMRIGKRIRIRQSWHAEEPDFEGIELIIDPKRAFGTGHHATTRLVIEWLEENIRGGERIMDIGTGTGILAMVALRLGAISALAIDNDSDALECAKDNAAANGFGRELELKTGSFDHLDAGEFDVIAANLSEKVMPQLCAILPTMLKPGGVACLSGLQLQDYSGIKSVLLNAGLQINARMDCEGWLALEISKRPNP